MGELKLNHRLILEITALGFMMLTSNLAGINNPSFVPLAVEKPIAQVQERKIENVEIEKAMTVEEYVRGYFSDIPIMVEIARCESRFRQYDKNGEVLRGVQNSFDLGVMQINEMFHSKDSDRLGYDIMTLEGNTSYARHLFEKYGVSPWRSSSPCWEKTVAYSEYKELALLK